MRPWSSLNSTVKETLISEINFEVVWRWKRRLASEPVPKQLGGTSSILKCVSRNLLEFERLCTQIPCGSIPLKVCDRVQEHGPGPVQTTIKVLLFDYTKWFLIPQRRWKAITLATYLWTELCSPPHSHLMLQKNMDSVQHLKKLGTSETPLCWCLTSCLLANGTL